jgi:hypothetical protein
LPDGPRAELIMVICAGFVSGPWPVISARQS